MTSMFVVGLRFIGPTAFAPKVNAAGAVRCEIFSTVTLPALALAIKELPPKTTVNIVLINQTAILEPTCVKVIDKTKSILGDRLHFSNTDDTYYTMFPLDDDYIFFSRLDTDNAFHPSTFKAIHANFMNSGMPFAVLSPYFGNLWYPTAGDKCGNMIYNTNLRRYPIMQTSAFHKSAYKKYMGLNSDKDFEHYLTKSPAKQSIPYHYEHLKPELVFRRFPEDSFIFSSVSDSILYFNIWENGLPGMIYTQTGLQSSLVRRGWKNTSHLKWYDKYTKRDDDPDVCKVLETYGITASEVAEMRNLIQKSQKYLRMDNLNAGFMHTNVTREDQW